MTDGPVQLADDPEAGVRTVGLTFVGHATVQLEIDGLRTTFSSGGATIRAVDDLSVTLDRGRTLEQEGFIHCSYTDQVEATLERFYGDLDDVVGERQHKQAFLGVDEPERLDRQSTFVQRVVGGTTKSEVTGGRIGARCGGDVTGEGRRAECAECAECAELSDGSPIVTSPACTAGPPYSKRSTWACSWATRTSPGCPRPCSPRPASRRRRS